jgi:outer membrane protein TolC
MAFTDQFSQGAPSYTAGLVLEVPLGNRAAASQRRMRQHELQHATHTLRATLAAVVSDVEVAAQTLEASAAVAEGRRQAVEATAQEVAFLTARWRAQMGDERTAGLLLEDLLNAHDRLLDEEQALVQASVAHSVASIELQRATATLVHEGEPLCLGRSSTVVERAAVAATSGEEGRTGVAKNRKRSTADRSPGQQAEEEQPRRR